MASASARRDGREARVAGCVGLCVNEGDMTDLREEEGANEESGSMGCLDVARRGDSVESEDEMWRGEEGAVEDDGGGDEPVDADGRGGA